MRVNQTEGSWDSLCPDILCRVGCELQLRDLLSARRVCRLWRSHVSCSVAHVPHPQLPGQRELIQLDTQPPQRAEAWDASLSSLAACLPRLGELMVYASGRVPSESLDSQLRSLPLSLPGLTKLELRYILPYEPVLGTVPPQLQPALSTLTGLRTLYLIMGGTPRAADLSAELPFLPALRDLKFMSGHPDYGMHVAELEALSCATQLERLQVVISGEVLGDELWALSPMVRLRSLQVEIGPFKLQPAAICALRQMSELQELSLALYSTEHTADLFSLPSLERLCLHYNVEYGYLDPHMIPLDVGDEVLAELLRGHAVRPVLHSLCLQGCLFLEDPISRVALLTSLTNLSMIECRWHGAQPGAAGNPDIAVAAPGAPQEAAAVAPQHQGGQTLPVGPWSALKSLTRLTAFRLNSCDIPPIGEGDLAVLKAAWTGMKELQIDARGSPATQLPLSPPSFNVPLSCWRCLESLELTGLHVHDPRVTVNVAWLPPTLTDLHLASMTLVHSSAGRTAVARALGMQPDTVSASGGVHAARSNQAEAPVLPVLENLVLGAVRLDAGVSLESLLTVAPNLRSLDISNIVPRLTDERCTVLAALTALTALRLSQPEGPASSQPASPSASSANSASGSTAAATSAHADGLTFAGLAALTGLRNLRQLEWLPWGCQFGVEHGDMLTGLRKLQLLTVPRWANDADRVRVAEAMREKLALCDVVGINRSME